MDDVIKILHLAQFFFNVNKFLMQRHPVNKSEYKLIIINQGSHKIAK